MMWMEIRLLKIAEIALLKDKMPILTPCDDLGVSSHTMLKATGSRHKLAAHPKMRLAMSQVKAIYP